MKQQETINQMEKGVIKLGFKIIFLIVNLFLFRDTFSQEIRWLESEQYEILANNYRNARVEPVLVHFHTIKYEPWMKSAWGAEIISENGVGFCSFDDPSLEQAFLELEGQILGLVEKKIDPKKLPTKFKLTRKKSGKNVRFISEAVIIGNFSFQFVRITDNKSIHVQKKGIDGNWVYECGIPLAFELH